MKMKNAFTIACVFMLSSATFAQTDLIQDPEKDGYERMAHDSIYPGAKQTYVEDIECKSGPNTNANAEVGEIMVRCTSTISFADSDGYIHREHPKCAYVYKKNQNPAGYIRSEEAECDW